MFKTLSLHCVNTQKVSREIYVLGKILRIDTFFICFPPINYTYVHTMRYANTIRKCFVSVYINVVGFLSVNAHMSIRMYIRTWHVDVPRCFQTV